jgi:hypothetical protein
MNRTLALLVLLAPVSPAGAFDAWGFHSGMSISQAASAAEQQGLTVRPWDAKPGAHYRNVTYSTPDAPTDYIAGFCDGRLVWLSHDYKPTAGMLYDVLEDLQKSYGKPTLDANSTLVAEGQVRSLDFYFPARPADLAHVGVNFHFGSEDHFGIQVMHQVAKATCPQAAGHWRDRDL